MLNPLFSDLPIEIICDIFLFFESNVLTMLILSKKTRNYIINNNLQTDIPIIIDSDNKNINHISNNIPIIFKFNKSVVLNINKIIITRDPCHSTCILENYIRYENVKCLEHIRFTCGSIYSTLFPNYKILSMYKIKQLEFEKSFIIYTNFLINNKIKIIFTNCTISNIFIKNCLLCKNYDDNIECVTMLFRNCRYY